MTSTCPTCGQPWPDKAGRVCALCGQKIGGRDKWEFVGAMVHHKDCANPTLSGTIPAPQPRLIEEKP